MALTVYEIPLISVPQELEIALGGTAYQLSFYWCWPVECWMMDIFTGDTGAPLLQGYPVVTGADLLAQFAYLGIPGQFIVQTDHDAMAQPTFTNLGALSHVFYLPFQPGVPPV